MAEITKTTEKMTDMIGTEVMTKLFRMTEITTE